MTRPEAPEARPSAGNSTTREARPETEGTRVRAGRAEQEERSEARAPEGKEPHRLPAADRSAAKAPAHWLLARLGKKVLRPGGLETTTWLLETVEVEGRDVVELAPGLGRTAALLLEHGPRSYTGVEADADAARIVADSLPQDEHHRVVHADARASGLEAESADVVLGEAMLSMHTDTHKLEIMREAARILRPGGRYAIHELGLTPRELSELEKTGIRRNLARELRVNARPLTLPEWEELARSAGFSVARTREVPMSLLEPRRILADEGLGGAARMLGRALRSPQLLARLTRIRRVFNDHRTHLRGVGLVLVRENDDRAEGVGTEGEDAAISGARGGAA